MKLRAATALTLRKFREQTGFSQEGLALEAGMDRSYISQIERKLKNPSLQTIFDLAKAMGIKPSRFVARVEEFLKKSS